jgi:hypothetical protein
MIDGLDVCATSERGVLRLAEPSLNRSPLLFMGVAFIVVVATLHGQSPASSAEYVAFRVDAERVVATVLVQKVEGPQVREGLSPPPVAHFGYEYFEPPDYWGVRNDHNVGDRWVIHTAPGQVFEATVQRRVGGYVGCDQGVGVLLRVAPEQASAFAGVSARYFVATPAPAETPNAAAVRSGVRTLPVSTLTPDMRRSIESILDTTLARELPGVRSEAAPFLARGLTAPYRSTRAWARQRLQIEDAMERGQGKLHYNVQAFQLAPNGVPVLFVRAEWLVERRQGFVASLWLRAGQPLEVLETNVRPAAWLRNSLFQGGVVPSHMGLILNVLDRDGDGWGEVLFSSEGYESRSISLLEYSPAGFQPAAISLGGGC